MKNRKVILIVPVILLALALTQSLVLVWQLFILSLLVILASYLWTVLGIRGVGVQVGQIPDHCHVGDRLNENVTVINNSQVPKLLLQLKANNNLPGYHQGAVFSLSANSAQAWQSTIYCRHRGRYTAGSFTVTVTDPLGLLSRSRFLGTPQDVLIYPATLELPFFESKPLDIAGYGSGGRMVSQFTPNASSVRQYSSTDSSSQIHWRSTAHTGQLMTKVFDADLSGNDSESIWIVADMYQAAQLGEEEETTEEYGITIAASLAKKYLDGRARVGLVASADTGYHLPPGSGEAHLQNILATLALMRANGQEPIDQMIFDLIERFEGMATVIVITPSHTEAVITAIRRLLNRGHRVVVVLLDAASFDSVAGNTNIARRLRLDGVPVYVVKKGVDLAGALDSRFSSLHIRHI